MSSAALQPLAPSGAVLAARDLVAGLRLRDAPLPPGRPRVVAAMVASADGRASVQGRSVKLGHPADRALFRELRTACDALLVGTGTLRAERYATVVDEEQMGVRRRAERPGKPLVATIARSLSVPDDIGLWAEPDQRIAVFTDAEGDAPTRGADVATHRGTEPLQVVEQLRSVYDARAVLCEGGPTVLHALLTADLLDDLVLTVAPLLVAGDAPSTLTGPALDPPLRLHLRGVWRAGDGDHLFLHYAR